MDDFAWLAHLDNGETYAEHDADGNARGWASVPHEQVVAIELVPQKTHLHPFRIEIPDGAMPIVFRRRRLTVHLSTDGSIESRGTISVVGHESAESSHYWAVYPDGRVMGAAHREAIQ